MGEESEEESWTFVGGDETDPELIVKKKALAEMEANMKASGSELGYAPPRSNIAMSAMNNNS